MNHFQIFPCKYYIFFIRTETIFTQSCKFYIVTMQPARAQENAVQRLLWSHNIFFTLRNVKFNVYFRRIYECH